MRSENVKILIAGYFGMGNLGDEAILEGEIRALRERLQGEIAVLSGNPPKTAQAYSCSAWRRSHPKDILSAISSCSLFLFGGGGLFQDITSFRSLLYYLLLLRLALFLEKKVAIFSVGIGPLKRRLSRVLVGRMLRKVHSVSLRERVSWEWARGWNKEALLTADSAFLLSSPPKVERKKEIGFCLRAGEGLKLESIKEWGWEVKRRGFSLSFLVFNPTDRGISQRLASELGGKVREPSSPGEALHLLSQLRGLIAVRLHSAILSALATTPFIALSYDPKVARIVGELGQPCFSLQEIDLPEAKEALQELLEAGEEASLILGEKCSIMKNRAEEGIERVVKLAKDG